MKLSENQIIFTLNIADLILFANSIGIGLTFGDANRDPDLQKLYYFGYTIQGQTKESLKLVPGKVKSKTMNSNHLKRLAVDFNFFIDGQLTYNNTTLQKLGDYWESLNKNNRWGGNWKFKDTPHFEMNL